MQRLPRIIVYSLLLVAASGAAYTVFAGAFEEDLGTSCTLPELGSQAYVGVAQSQALWDPEWVDSCLDLELDTKKLGCDIVAYRIHWFNGNWSRWFVPGVNDLYKKSGETLRRQWACFNDHEFQIIYKASEQLELKMLNQ